MRRSCLIGWSLCLCASMAVSASDDAVVESANDDVMREDGTRPKTGTEAAAPFLRCNKVRRVEERQISFFNIDLVTARTFHLFICIAEDLNCNYNGQKS